jgi:mannose-6-phosphate isomerase-like protein (cupin superfamily)
MRYWRHSNEVNIFVPSDHIRTFNRKLVSFEDGIKNFEVIIGEMEKGGLGLPHVHDDIEQVMYILEGRMYVEINGEQAELTAGHAVWIPEKTIHEAKNIGPGTLRFVVINAPSK